MSFSPDVAADFRNLLYIAWKALGLPDPTPMQYDIAHYLQFGPDLSVAPWEAPNNRIIVGAQRGEGKSWITALFVLHYLGLDPVNHEVMVVSANKDKADDFSTFCQTCLEVIPELKFLHPRGTAKRWSLVNFDVRGHRAAQVASCRARGIYGQLTGGRAGLIVADDVEIPNTAETQLQREKLRKRVKEFKSIQMGVPRPRTVYLGTPHVEDSLYNHLISIGYHKRLWPARYPDADWMRRMGEHLAPWLAEACESRPELIGLPTDPDRFGELELLEAEAEGRTHFALQQMLDTQPSDSQRRPLKVSDLIIDTCDPEVAPEKLVWAADRDLVHPGLPNHAPDGQRLYGPLKRLGAMVPYEGALLAVDPAGSGADELTWCVAKVVNGRIHVPELVGVQGGFEDKNLRAIALCAKAHKVSKIVVEQNFGMGMFSKLLMPYLKELHPCAIEEIHHSRQKELRIADTLEPLMNGHKLVIDPVVIQRDHDSLTDYDNDVRMTYSLVYQMTRLTRDKGCLGHDDRLDVLAMACAAWVDAVAVSEDDAMEARQEELLMEEIAEFSKEIGGHPRRVEPCWTDTCRGVRPSNERTPAPADHFWDDEDEGFRITVPYG